MITIDPPIRKCSQSRRFWSNSYSIPSSEANVSHNIAAHRPDASYLSVVITTLGGVSDQCISEWFAHTATGVMASHQDHDEAFSEPRAWGSDIVSIRKPFSAPPHSSIFSHALLQSHVLWPAVHRTPPPTLAVRQRHARAAVTPYSYDASVRTRPNSIFHVQIAIYSI